LTTRNILHTEICDMLGIEYPILLAGMGGIAGEGHAAQPELVAAVSNAGGMGVLGATGLALDELRAEIKEIKKMTDKPFGVDVLFPEGIGEAPPPDMSLTELKKQFVPQPYIDFIEKLTAEYSVTLKEAKQELVWNVEHSKKQIQVMLEEKVPLYCAGLGIPDWLVPMAHEGDMKILGLAGNVRGAMRHKKAGADFIVAQGHEAGGHTGRIGTLALVPQVVDAVAPTPVLAAGGIGDGRGLVAALALSAVGVWVGTAFLFAEEANVIEVHRKALVAANEEDTRISRVWSGKTLRQMKNPIQEAFDNSGLKPLPIIIQLLFMLDFIDSLAKANRQDLLCSPVGQIAGMLKEIRPAREILGDMVNGAVEILNNKLPSRVKTRS